MLSIVHWHQTLAKRHWPVEKCGLAVSMAVTE
jgi:hypothetical protein